MGKLRPSRVPLLAVTALATIAPAGRAGADEGFWPHDRFPGQRVREVYGVSVDDAVLARAARAAIRVSENGTTGAFVSSDGLAVVKSVRTCLHGLRWWRGMDGRFASFCRDRALRSAIPLFDRLYCKRLESAADYDYVQRGFLARTRDKELRCPRLAVDTLVGIADITPTFTAKLAAEPPDQRSAAARRLARALERDCRKDASKPNETSAHCRVAIFHGGARVEQHFLRRHFDVRVVFSPEAQVTDLGDARDQIAFPDHDFSVAFVRVYDEQGQPLATPDYLRWSGRRLREGELTLGVTHTGPTQRRAPAARLDLERDLSELTLATVAEQRGLMREMAESTTLARGFDADGIDRRYMRHQNQADNLGYEQVGTRIREQNALLATLEARHDPGAAELKTAILRAQGAVARYSPQRDPLYPYLMQNLTGSQLIRSGVGLVFLAEGRDDVDHRLAAFLPETETRRLELALQKIAAGLPSGHPVLNKLLGDQTPSERATMMVRQTRFGDPAFDDDLIRRGREGAKAARDPVLDIFRPLYPEILASWQRRGGVQRVIDVAAELADAATYRLQGAAAYPEGTGTVRVSYGSVRRYSDHGQNIEPVTTLRDLFNRARHKGAYQIPERWFAARDALDLSTPLNIASDHDGFEQSAVMFDPAGALLAVMFGENRHHPGMASFYEGNRRRVVSVHGAAVLEVLRKVYGAHELLRELAGR